ncbi:MAG: zinc ABC transporter substrate-binding protein [Candidatus Margulisbacteria bacterium]|nr:zinc ABC transporter substrate-binding protein [Candidatus Margulisiibacteriota bacterium]
MRKRRMLSLIFMSCFILFMTLSGCQSGSTDPRPKIVCTIGMIADIVKNVGGEHIVVTGLMGPGVDPHLYKAKKSDINSLSQADIIFYNGLHLEAKLTDVFEKMQRRKTTVAITDYYPKSDLLSSIQYPDQHDPHVWFDVQIWQTAVKVVRDTLSEKYPAHKADFQKNAALYQKELAALHTYILDKVQETPIKQRVLVTAHDAFRYFGRAYGFTVKGLQGISTASEAGTKDIQDLADFIAKEKIKAIFVESSIPVRNIKAVQEAVASRGWNVKIGGELFSDAMGTEGTHEGTYIGMVKHNVDTIVNALR